MNIGEDRANTDTIVVNSRGMVIRRDRCDGEDKVEEGTPKQFHQPG